MRRISPLLPFAALFALTACGGGDAEPADAMMDMEPPEMESASKAPPPGAMVHIASPANGAEITGSSVTVTLEAMALPLAPGGAFLEGTGHHHLFLDADVTQSGLPIPSGASGIVHLGQMQTEHTFTDLTPGEHLITAVMADGLHFPFDPPVMTSITITVVAG